MPKPKIVAISGSTRTNSSNEIILNIITDLYSESLDIQLFKGLAELPHFNPDVPDKDIHATVKDFRELIARADGVIICTPEYVFSLPGSLKNALEWTVSTTVFMDKPVALLVASGLGEKAFESLQLIMKILVGKEIDAANTLLIQGARSKINPNGQFADEATLQRVTEVINAFMQTLPKTSPALLLN